MLHLNGCMLRRQHRHYLQRLVAIAFLFIAYCWPLSLFQEADGPPLRQLLPVVNPVFIIASRNFVSFE